MLNDNVAGNQVSLSLKVGCEKMQSCINLNQCAALMLENTLDLKKTQANSEINFNVHSTRQQCVFPFGKDSRTQGMLAHIFVD